MKRVKLDDAAPEVKRFVQTLRVRGEGLELELNGQIVCKVVSPQQLSDAERKALVDERWRLIRSAQKRTARVPASVIARKIGEAVETVRRRPK